VLSELRAGEKAVVPALNVVDTIKVVDSSGYVVATPDRANLRAMQTPQGFTVDVIKRAHESGGDATDDAALVSQLGIAVKVIPGSPRARKITTVEDLAWARELVSHP
jgi:2-C-methyl-D-erythritol 4-phosphate cytidylyltransferase